MKYKHLLGWLDTHLMLILSSFLLAFIPLYPKLPLFEAIPGYIVRVRIEDILILFTMIIWVIQAWRKKIAWNPPLTFVVIAYAVVGLLSTVSAVVITQTVPAEMLHIGKSLLHYFRYLEYFCLMFVAYSSITSLKQLKIPLIITILTVLAVSVYGLGQRYWYWPVYSTMNREFSKGVRLYLTEHARVQSTFGGHYDLAAYLVIMTPLLLAAHYLLKNRWAKVALFFSFYFAYWIIVATASRTSYIAFFLAILILIALITFKKETSWIRRLWWATKQYAITGILCLLILVTFGESMYERMLQSLRAYPKTFTAYNDMVHTINEVRAKGIAVVLSDNQREKIADAIKVAPPKDGISVDEAAVLVSSDTQPTPAKPSDVYVNVPTYETVATVSADGSVSTITVAKERTYTETAITHGLSLAIRLDTLWPRALQGFYRNPILGSGYATLTKETVGQFTEAESTDNNFLRTLGETGLLGFLTFYGAVVLAGYIAWKLYQDSANNRLVLIFVSAFLAATAGLLVNAIFIDVFAASKVAFTYWAFAGFILAIQAVTKPQYFSYDYFTRFLKKNFSETKIISTPATQSTNKKKKKTHHS